jgi:hypothetical protein
LNKNMKSDDVCCITKEEIIPTEEDKEIQCQLIGRYSIETFILNPEAVLFYTAFKSFEHFMFLFNCLGPPAYDLNYKCVNLTPQDQLFLTLIKLWFLIRHFCRIQNNPCSRKLVMEIGRHTLIDYLSRRPNV